MRNVMNWDHMRQNGYRPTNQYGNDFEYEDNRFGGILPLVGGLAAGAIGETLFDDDDWYGYGSYGRPGYGYGYGRRPYYGRPGYGYGYGRRPYGRRPRRRRRRYYGYYNSPYYYNDEPFLR